MKFYGKTQETANQILTAFQSPETLPAALAPIFIRRTDGTPCRSWSWSNQLITALAGHSDARGFRQWEQVQRHVKKGEKSFQILAPCKRKVTTENDDGTTNERMSIYGFRSQAVFGLNQTDGEPLPVDTEAAEWLAGLSLREVADEWELSVESYNGRDGDALGQYAPGRGIALGVRNLATWCHEMIHAADDRLIAGGLRGGQHADQEIVAELGAAVLLRVLGHDSDADLGGCWEYVRAYSRRTKTDTLAVCESLLRRTCEAVALILDTADAIRAAESADDDAGAEPEAETELDYFDRLEMAGERRCEAFRNGDSV